MIEDLSARFWTSRGWLPPAIPAVERLFPSNLTEILDKKDTNLVVVATFATLVAIYKKEIVPCLVESGGSRLSARYATCSC